MDIFGLFFLQYYIFLNCRLAIVYKGRLVHFSTRWDGPVKFKCGRGPPDHPGSYANASNTPFIFLVQRLLSMQDERGQPCIFYALESRSNKALACLLDHSKNADCVITANGESLLHVATRMGEVCLLRCLLDRDLFRNLVDHVDQEHGRTPLHIAAKYNHIEVAKELLLHGAKLDRQDTAGNTPIFMAASKGHALMLKVFLQHGECISKSTSVHEQHSIESLVIQKFKISLYANRRSFLRSLFYTNLLSPSLL